MFPILCEHFGRRVLVLSFETTAQFGTLAVVVDEQRRLSTVRIDELVVVLIGADRGSLAFRELTTA